MIYYLLALALFSAFLVGTFAVSAVVISGTINDWRPAAVGAALWLLVAVSSTNYLVRLLP